MKLLQIIIEEPEPDSDNEVPVKNQFLKAPAKQPVEEKDESSDSDEWPSESDSSSESSDDDDAKYTTLREKFLKKSTNEDDEEKERRKQERRQERKEKERRKMKKDDDEDGGGVWHEVQKGVALRSVSLYSVFFGILILLLYNFRKSRKCSLRMRILI